jgi:hypothetical protein
MCESEIYGSAAHHIHVRREEGAAEPIDDGRITVVG